jgi:antitoxin YefM
MASMTATDARKKFFEIVKQSNTSHEIFHVHHKSGDVVILSEEEYTNLIETVELLSEPNFKRDMEQSISEAKMGQTLSFDEVFGEPQ